MQNPWVIFFQKCWVWQLNRWRDCCAVIWQVWVPGQLDIEESTNYSGQKNNIQLLVLVINTPKTPHQTSNMKQWNTQSLWRQEVIKLLFAGYFFFQLGFSFTHAHPRTQSGIQNAHQHLMTFLVCLLLRFLFLEYLQLWKRIYIIHIKLYTNGEHLPAEFEESRKSENIWYSSLFFHYCNRVLI